MSPTLLSDPARQAVVWLAHQYRMNADIMSLSNTLVYNHRLVCGTAAVADAQLRLPTVAAARVVLQETGDWAAALLDPARAVIFFNTDEVGAGAARKGRV